MKKTILAIAMLAILGLATTEPAKDMVADVVQSFSTFQTEAVNTEDAKNWLEQLVDIIDSNVDIPDGITGIGKKEH